MNAKEDPKKLAGEVQMFRIRIATAESKLKVLREQARQAKRRRKQAKLLAQRARKQYKGFKAGVNELQQALAEAEARLFQAGGYALARKMAKAKAVANRGASPLIESKPVVREPRPAVARKSRVSGRVTRKQPRSQKPKSFQTAQRMVPQSIKPYPASQIPEPQITEPIS